jgi:hydrogenase maturation protein HypF
MAENGLENRSVIGLSFDGTGYGPDGSIWGGEVLLADYAGFERFAHLQTLPLPGGDAAIRHPWRIAVGYAAALGLKVDDLPFLRGMDERAVRITRQQVEKNLNAPLTSSMGRLFDAVAALAGVRADVSYEAQAAIELEVLARKFTDEAGIYPFDLNESRDGMEVEIKSLLSVVIEDVRAGLSAGQIGARFHRSMATLAVKVSLLARKKSGLNEVALSGGVWQNQLLLELARPALEREGFVVYFHRQTPANDGGLALGQAVVANHVIMKVTPNAD